MSSDLPKLFSDEEFDKALKERRSDLVRPEHQRWDNSSVRPPPRQTDGLPESWIEQQFPHIAKKLTVVWRSEACAVYISDLIVNRQRDSRLGFPPEVLEDLLMLHEINDMLLRAGKPEPPGPPPFSAAPPRR